LGANIPVAADKRPFDFLDFFLANERFTMIWRSCSFHKTIDGLYICLYSGQTGADIFPSTYTKAR
jgi:hypothetical protein